MKKLHDASFQDQDLVFNSKPGKGKHLDDLFFRFLIVSIKCEIKLSNCVHVCCGGCACLAVKIIYGI